MFSICSQLSARWREGTVEPGNTTVARLAALKASIAHLERPARTDLAHLPFGIPAIDARLPGGGLVLGALHEVVGSGPAIEHGAAAALLTAGVLARLPGQVLWVLEWPDLFAPALDAVGLHPDRVIYAEAGTFRTVLLTMEEGLRHAGLAGVVGELSGRLTLTASRRLQLAAEQSGVTCFALGLIRNHDDALLVEPTAAVTRWRVVTLPSPPRLAHSPETPGLARPRWRLNLVRCRGGEPASWIVEATDATGHLGVPADLADRPVAAPPARRRATGR
jgi:protein ImuA